MVKHHRHIAAPTMKAAVKISPVAFASKYQQSQMIAQIKVWVTLILMFQCFSQTFTPIPIPEFLHKL